MKMTKVLKFLMLFVMTFGISTVLISCGDDEPDSPVQTPEDPDSSDDFVDLYGYWINADKTGAMNIVKYSNNKCKVLYYVYCDEFTKKYAEWTDYYDGGTFSVLAPYNEYKHGCEAIKVKISYSSDNKIVLTNAGSGNSLSSYIFTRVSEDEFFEYLENGGNSSSSQGFSKSSFIGIWKIADQVFELKSNGTLGWYYLTSYYSNTFRDYSDGTWSFDEKNSTLVLKYQSSTGYQFNHEWVITEMTDSYFIYRQGDYWDEVTRQYSLPTKEQTPQQSQLAGTNWSARIDGDYVELSFKNDGKFTETWAGEKSTSTYTELDSNTIIIGDGTVLSNIFGESPFNFALNSNMTQLTLYDSFEKLVFTRKQ